MSANPISLQHLLSTTGQVVKHHKEMAIAKGEHFNIFSVLKIESRENNTHSAFLTELLNPKGSHEMGDVFLKLFLLSINHEENTFDTDSAFVKAEQDIGEINYKEKEDGDCTDAEGGRIDIYLVDKDNNIISIENKIHAIDQKAQVQRYYNHCNGKNTVYYLTLTGKEPIEESKIKLKSGEHFHLISYRDHIVNWLELCLREVSNFSQLREAINQYIVLIKKLTHTLDKEQEKKLFDVMIDNLEESRFVADNYTKMINKIWDDFRTDLIRALEKRLVDKSYTISTDKHVYNKYSRLWIDFKGNPKNEIRFSVQPFSGVGHREGNMFVGLYDLNNILSINTISKDELLNEKWKKVRYLVENKSKQINFNDSAVITKLADRKSNKIYLDLFVDQIIKFIEDYENLLPKEFVQPAQIDQSQ